MADTIVARLYAEFRALVQMLEAGGEPSLRNTAEDCFRKALLLSAASYFETVVLNILINFTSQLSAGNEQLIEFVKRQALNRRYHTLFDWDSNSANKFLSLFGDTFRTTVEARVKTDDGLAESIRAFLEMGRERNRLVHQDFGNFALEKTTDEIFGLYEAGLRFVDALPGLLNSAAQDS